MFKRLIGVFLIIIMMISISGCSFNMPVVANNPGQKWIYKDNRVIIDVVKNSAKNRLDIPKEVEKALLDKYANQENTTKKHVHTENYYEKEKRCSKVLKYANSMSALRVAKQRYKNCMDLSGYRSSINYTGKSSSIHKQTDSDEDILLSYSISSKDDSEKNYFDFKIEIDDAFIVIYLVGLDKCTLPYGMSDMISDIVKDNVDKPLYLKYYKY